MSGSDRWAWSRREFLARMAVVATGFWRTQSLAQGTDWRFLNELKKELKG
jgi:hypothetical protein